MIKVVNYSGLGGRLCGRSCDWSFWKFICFYFRFSEVVFGVFWKLEFWILKVYVA